MKTQIGIDIQKAWSIVKLKCLVGIRDIGEQTMDKSKPISSIDKDKFTIQEYLYLQWVGYSVNAIIEALGMPRNKFWEYKAEHLN